MSFLLILDLPLYIIIYCFACFLPVNQLNIFHIKLMVSSTLIETYVIQI